MKTLLFILILMILMDCFSSFMNNVILLKRKIAISPSPPLSSSTVKGYVQNVNITQWGLFDQASVTLKSNPSFTVITGETGSGKSVFISALEYITGHNIKSKFKQNKNSNIETAVTVKFSNDIVTRKIITSTRKSQCLVNDEKVLIKDLSLKMDGAIRFWTPDSIQKLNDDEFITYIDLNLDSTGNKLRTDISDIFDRWTQADQKLQKLEGIKEKLERGDEVMKIKLNLKEIMDFERNLVSFLFQLFNVIQDFGYISGEKSSKDKSLPMIEELHSQLDKILVNQDLKSPNIDLKECWDAVKLGEVLLKKLCKVVSSITLPQSETNKNSIFSDEIDETAQVEDSMTLNSMTAPEFSQVGMNTNGNDFESIITNLEDYSEGIMKLKNDLSNVGIVSSNINDNLSEAYDLLLKAVQSVQSAEGKLQEVQKSIPNVRMLLRSSTEITSQWERLARKHRNSCYGLQELKSSWQSEVREMKNLHILLPQQLEEVNKLRMNYIETAMDLTLRRYLASKGLSERLNIMLPKLEMSDKLMTIRLKTLIDPLIETSEELNEENIKIFCYNFFHSTTYKKINESLKPVGAVTSNGWDSASVSVASRDEVLGGLNLVQIIPSISDFAEGEFDQSEDEGVENTDQEKAQSITQILSSGEKARLALALETVSLQSLNSVEGSGDEGCVIFDEVDAHVGGEAAAAVARLLRSQGNVRQVLAVTHNPVIAAAAHRHILVRRRKETISSPENEKTVWSDLIELDTREEKEKEIARMATGNLETSAGLHLAQALLELDFDNN